jgi:hypothetical protein
MQFLYMGVKKKEEQFCGELGLLPESRQDATQACFGE